MSASSENIAIDHKSIPEDLEENIPDEEIPQIESHDEVASVTQQITESDDFIESDTKTSEDGIVITTEAHLEESMPKLVSVEIPEKSINAIEMELVEPELSYQETLPSSDDQIIPMETEPFDETELSNTTPTSQAEPSLNQPSTENEPSLIQPASENEPLIQPASENEPLIQPASENEPSLNQPASENEPSLNQPASENEPSLIQSASENEPSMQPVSENEPSSIQSASKNEPSLIQPVSENEPSLIQSASKNEPSLIQPVSENEPPLIHPDSQKEIPVTDLPAQEEVSVNESISQTQLPSVSEQVTVSDSSKNDPLVQNELSNVEPLVTKNTTATDPTANETESVVLDKSIPKEQSPSSSQAKSGSTFELNNDNEPEAKRRRMDDEVKNCPTGLYLDNTVVPILRMALITLDRLRPEDPMQYVIDFLLQNKEKFSPEKRLPTSNA